MLETEIKKLTSQIEQLNNNFEAFFSSATQTEPTTEESKQLELPLEEPEQTQEAQAPTITRDSLRDLCMVKVRENRKNRAKIKDILKDHGAKLVDDLDDDKLEEVNDKIGAL